MIFDDGTREFEAAIEKLIEAREAQGMEAFEVFTIDGFLEHAKGQAISLDERVDVLDQATFLIENLYCHLPFKRARYAIDPVQQLRLLQRQLDDKMDVAEFHSRLLKIFASLRDVHTNYFLPEPYATAAAFLPFQVNYFHDAEGVRRYEVAEIMTGFGHPHFVERAELIAWNGLTMNEAVEATSDIAAGANESARFLRGLRRLTLRPLNSSLPPRENYVIVEYRAPQDEANGETRAILLPWRVVTSFGELREQTGSFGSVAIGPELGRQALQRLFYYDKPGAYYCSYNPAGKNPGMVYSGVGPSAEDMRPRLPGQLDFQFSNGRDRSFALPTSHLRLDEKPDLNFAYLRIFDFSVPVKDRRGKTDEFQAEFRRILELANEWAPDGLILDIRSNPGGDITLAEALLQYLTPRDIEPARFAILQTSFVQNLATRRMNARAQLGRDREWKDWAEDLTQAPFTGNPLTRAFPLSKFEDINTTGQIYQGPALLLIDGLTYSAADFFAAGFQDNGVGLILGVQPSTGGGGANRWSHTDLVRNLSRLPNFPLHDLPKGARMGVSLRRSMRVGVRNGGQPLEDAGVTADRTHPITAEDVHNFSRDLLQRACQILSGQRGFHLSVTSQLRDPQDPRLLHFTVQCRGLMRIEANLSGVGRSFPQRAFPVTSDGEHQFSLEMDALPPFVTSLQLRGYARNEFDSLELSAETKVSLQENTTSAAT